MISSSIYQLNDAFKLDVVHVELDPEKLGAHEVLGKTIHSVISTGTELLAYRGAPPLRPGKVYPRVLGYCNVAEIIAVGSNVTSYKTGDYILTFQSHRSHFVTHEDNIVLRFDKKNFRKEYTSLYLFHLGYIALINGNIQPGLSVAVVGMGLLGITTAQLSQISGCDTHCFTARAEAVSELKKLGFNQVHQQQSTNTLTGTNCGEGVDLVVVTSNSWDSWRTSLQLARKGGIITVLGHPGRGEKLPDFNPLDSQYFYDKQLTLKSVGYYSELDAPAQDIRFTLKRNMNYLHTLARENKIDPTKIISGEIKWQELPALYDRLHNNIDRGITYLINW